jgi:SAM-dependent methyltransferase
MAPDPTTDAHPVASAALVEGARKRPLPVAAVCYLRWMSPSSRDECLAAFESYYDTHYRLLVADGDARGPASDEAKYFTESALRGLYAGYCRGAAARLHDTLRVAEQTSAPLRPRSILDVTCFATTQVIRMAYPEASVHACDKHLKWAPFLEGVESRVCNLERDDRLPYEDEMFDLVIFTETLEHIPRSPYTLLREMRRVLSPDGVLIFSVPNLSNLINRVKLLLGKDILSIELGHSDSFGHFREYNMREVVYLLEACGFRTLHREYIYHDPTHQLTSRNLPALVKAMLKRPLMAGIPSLRPACFAVARKREAAAAPEGAAAARG